MRAQGGAAAAVSDSRRIGFRVFSLVTGEAAMEDGGGEERCGAGLHCTPLPPPSSGNDTDPSTLAGRDGSDTFTMRFKVRACITPRAGGAAAAAAVGWEGVGGEEWPPQTRYLPPLR